MITRLSFVQRGRLHGPLARSKSATRRLLQQNDSVVSYLDYAKQKDLSNISTVFQGTLYELSTKTFLDEHFNISRLLLQGGANDKGIDIRCVWDLKQFLPEDPLEQQASIAKLEKQYQIGNKRGKHIKPLLLRQNPSLKVKLFVQCKAYETKEVDPKMVRELNGTYSSCIPYYDRWKTFFMYVSPTNLSKQARYDFDSSHNPLVFMQLEKTQLKLHGDPYNVNHYERARLKSFHCNHVASWLLKGLNWERDIQIIKRKASSPSQELLSLDTL
ncbi:hypothetical protein LJB42_004645 [Komagataella kurtzmanii]|nr:hypothetical protein LJB42_004645 [Komagataella kurtzmanii]